jgi:hypothetical protein
VSKSTPFAVIYFIIFPFFFGKLSNPTSKPLLESSFQAIQMLLEELKLTLSV